MVYDNPGQRLYIATFLIQEIRPQEASIYDACLQLSTDMEPYFFPLFIDQIDDTNIVRTVVRRSRERIPDFLKGDLGRLFDRRIKVILKSTRGTSPEPSERFWLDGNVSDREINEETWGRVQEYLANFPNIGPVFASYRGRDVRIHIRGYADEEGAEELRRRLARSQFRGFNLEVPLVVGHSIEKAEGLDRNEDTKEDLLNTAAT